MSTHDPKSSSKPNATSNPSATRSFDDARIEDLLVEFFRAEMPADLRDRAPESPAERPVRTPATTAAPAPTVTPVATAYSANGSKSRGLLGLVVAAACLFVMVLAGNGLRPRSSDDARSDSDNVADAETGADRNADDLDVRPMFQLNEDDLFVESIEGHVEDLDRQRFDTTRGPVELRAVRETTNVSAFDPASGFEFDLETQVLEIEIVPIDDASRENEDAKESDDTPTPRDDDPTLPESTPDR